ncbi:MAG TPA: twin-arginine translocation signal domain-containing protein, partial [Burkholderiales bacterium]|nr:twin-arginine translocation signal domain-containing protein [Burkholderiales bacterium]
MAKSKSKVAARDGGVVASRRKFLREAGAGATALTMPFFFVRNAVAADKELKIVLWSHFVPSYD